jgi:glycosyltransferase involved in cell wall biosynthesis
VQDYEPDFYPAGTMKLLSFESYRLGLEMISNTKGLQMAISKHGIESNYFTPGIDFDIFNSKGRLRVENNPIRIFFYMRPVHLRNCFEINLELIRKLKKKFGASIEIVCAGADFNLDDFGLRDLVTNVGMVPYAQNGQMYRGIDIGVSLMASSHPSYPPLEMMACGVAVVTNYNPATEWIFNSEVCEYVPGTLDSLYQAAERLVTDSDYRNEMGLRASKYIQTSMPTWSDACKNFVSAIGLE